MDVHCERCRAHYVFDDARVTPAGVAVRCSRCGHVFKVKKPAPAVTDSQRPVTESQRRAVTPAVMTPAVTESQESPVTSTESALTESRLPVTGGQLQRPGRRVTDTEVHGRRVTDSEVQPGDSPPEWFAAPPQPPTATGPAVAPFAAPPQPPTAAAPPAAPDPAPGGAPDPAPGVEPPAPAPAPAPAAAIAPRESASLGGPEPAAVLDVDVTFDDEPPPQRKGGSRAVWVLAVGLVLGLAGALAVPRLLERSPAPPPVLLEPPPPRPAPAPPAPPPVAAPPPAPAPPPAAAQAPEPPPPAPPAEPAPEEARPARPAVTAKQPAAPPTARALLDRADALLEKGDTAAALELFGRVAAEDPENVEAQAGRGLCYLDLDEWAPAEASFQAALRIEPDHADALLGLAETYRFEGKKAQAIPVYERFLARYPESEDAEVAKNALEELRK